MGSWVINDFTTTLSTFRTLKLHDSCGKGHRKFVSKCRSYYFSNSYLNWVRKMTVAQSNPKRQSHNDVIVCVLSVIFSFFGVWCAFSVAYLPLQLPWLLLILILFIIFKSYERMFITYSFRVSHHASLVFITQDLPHNGDYWLWQLASSHVRCVKWKARLVTLILTDWLG